MLEILLNATANKPLPFTEFIALMALMMSLVALAIDAILPALGLIEASFGVENSEDIQLIVSLLLLGLGFGQLFFGPISDSFGRKPVMYAGYGVFFIGSLICIYGESLQWLLIGRFAQGFGLAAPRVLSMAIIRDQYAGRHMAQIMSFIMVVFILVPMLAPILGQGVIMVAPWQAIFSAMLMIGVISLLWFGIRQTETLKVQYRKPFEFQVLRQGVIEVCCNRVAIGYTLTAGIVSGAFITYLASAQQLFQQAYKLGDYFAFYFAALAFAIGISSFFNGKIVLRKGMQYMVLRSAIGLVASSTIFFIIAYTQQGLPPLSWTTVYLVLAFSCLGILFGNLSSLAMEPLGHLAGVGAAVVGSLSTLIAALLAIAVAQFFNNTMLPLTAAFAVAGASAAFISYCLANSTKNIHLKNEA